MSQERKRAPGPPEALEVEPIPDEALDAVAGGLANPDSSEGPVCCSCVNCSPQ
ncbi:MAG TPA: hypothetical protein VHG91_06150 [Longimicrobium sp.]|nr:hypothetical protein [Longimicrobium sp.]